MDRTEKDYSAFERAMDESRIYIHVSDFSRICRILGADQISLDRKIFDELGWHGQDLVDFYIRCENNPCG